MRKGRPSCADFEDDERRRLDSLAHRSRRRRTWPGAPGSSWRARKGRTASGRASFHVTPATVCKWQRRFINEPPRRALR